MTSKIASTLKKIGVISESTVEVYSDATRDKSDLQVYRDKKSGVIFIPEHYVGDTEYRNGSYNASGPVTGSITSAEVLRNVERRKRAYGYLAHNKDVCDFGCGEGLFLQAVAGEAKSVAGVELDNSNIDTLKKAGVPCYNSLSHISDDSLDCVFAFHVLEHLPDPLAILGDLHQKLRIGGTLLVEVPHAGDFLLRENVGCEAFKKFTLWSQHLVLHTRESLKALVEEVNFQVAIIEGVQRYPLSNHLGWLIDGRPGGHTRFLRQLDTPLLEAEYEKSLSKIDATDSLVMIAHKVQ